MSSRSTFWVFDANGHACSKGCDPAYSMDDDGFWRCMHGQWRVVDEAPSVDRPHHPHTCPGHCRQHPLINGLVSDFFRATDAGLFWGDILIAEEMAALDAETPAQRAARLDREAAEERRRVAAIQQSEKAKVNDVVSAMRAIEPSAKSRLPIHRHGLKPCRYFCYQGVLGRPNPAEKDPKSGMWWPAGCAPHLKKKCEFFHPDEPEWALIVAGKAQQVERTGGRDFSALKGGRR
ncbi:MAG: hypothetical protein EBU82_08500 [Flavobacteriia bacterium]|nr:hypothetical protein [Flavobacteriia bacterium]